MAEILTERLGAIGILTLSQADKLNAMTLAMWDELPHAVTALSDDPGVRAIVVRGDGAEAFSAGADISEFPEKRSTAELADRYSKSVGAGLTALAETRKPTIAMLHGVCVGGQDTLIVSDTINHRVRLLVPTPGKAP